VTRCKQVEVLSEVGQFVASHSDTYFRTALKDRHRVLTVEATEELSLVTTLVRLVASPSSDPQARDIVGGCNARLQAPMIALLAKFSDRSSWLSRMPYQATQLQKELIEYNVQHIIANLAGYTRVRMAPQFAGELRPAKGPKQPVVRILLQPQLVSSSLEDSGDLGVILRHLKDGWSQYVSSD